MTYRKVSFPSAEYALEVLDEKPEGTGQYILPRYTSKGIPAASADGMVRGAVTGNGNALENLYFSADRRGEKTLVNLRRITHFRKVRLDLPESVQTSLDQYENLEATEENIPELKRLEDNLHSYFLN